MASVSCDNRDVGILAGYRRALSRRAQGAGGERHVLVVPDLWIVGQVQKNFRSCCQQGG